MTMDIKTCSNCKWYGASAFGWDEATPGYCPRILGKTQPEQPDCGRWEGKP